MNLLDAVLLSALQGLAEVLPISQSGHVAIAKLWLSPGEAATLLSGLLHLSTAVAIGVAAHKRLASALSEGVRGIARPALFQTSQGARDAAVLAVATAASLLSSTLIRPYVEMWRDAPVAVGLGLVTTGLGVASMSLAPKPHADALPLRAAVVVGLAHGLASFPGASRVGTALALLVWLGVKPGRALDLSLLLTMPALAASFAQGLFGIGAAADAELTIGTIALGCVVAFLAATVGCAALRTLLARRRVGALALWIVPLGLATIAYARALPGGSA